MGLQLQTWVGQPGLAGQSRGLQAQIWVGQPGLAGQSRGLQAQTWVGQPGLAGQSRGLQVQLPTQEQPHVTQLQVHVAPAGIGVPQGTV